MGAPKGTHPPGGSRLGKPNKTTADLKAMIIGALSEKGGQEYLVRQADENPKAFMALVGRLIPSQHTGLNDTPLIPDAPDPHKVAQALLSVIRGAREEKK